MTIEHASERLNTNESKMSLAGVSPDIKEPQSKKSLKKTNLKPATSNFLTVYPNNNDDEDNRSVTSYKSKSKSKEKKK